MTDHVTTLEQAARTMVGEALNASTRAQDDLRHAQAGETANGIVGALLGAETELQRALEFVQAAKTAARAAR